MDKIKRFELAIENANFESDKKVGRKRIGQLGEKMLHLVLKHYYCSDTSYHEVDVGRRFVADIKMGDKIIEVQTQNLYSMKKKLDYYLTLPDLDLTIVHPIARIKWISWINKKTGEISPKRKSTKKGSIYEMLPELYSIKDYILRDGIAFRVCLIDMVEYKVLDGWSKDKKQGSTKLERVPVALIEDILFDQLEDYAKFVPHSLDIEFTVKDYQKATQLTPGKSSMSVNLLKNMGVITQIGKKGRSYLYTRNF